VVAGNSGPPLRAAFGRQRPAGSFDVGSLKPLDHIPGRTDMTVAEIAGVTHVHKRLFALFQCRLHLLAEPLAGEHDPLAGDKFAVEPRRSLVADLLVKADGRQELIRMFARSRARS